MRTYLASVVATALLAAAPAHAEIAATWFNLDPPPAATEGDTPLDTVFYSRTARYQGLARLSEPYQLVPGDPKGGESRPARRSTSCAATRPPICAASSCRATPTRGRSPA